MQYKIGERFVFYQGKIFLGSQKTKVIISLLSFLIPGVLFALAR